jgi:predicted nucleic acid-binding protein
MICVDTDVMIDILRRYTPAVAWLRSRSAEDLALPGLMAMELLQGCRNRAEQRRVERLIRPYRVYWPSHANGERAFQDYAMYYLRHALGILDALHCRNRRWPWRGAGDIQRQALPCGVYLTHHPALRATVDPLQI